MFDFATILRIVRTATDAASGFEQLLDEVLKTFGPVQQAELKEALADARARSDRLHADLQAKAGLPAN